MVLPMRATLRIDDQLYAQVRARAVETGRSIGEVVEDALRIAFASGRDSAQELPPLPTFEGSGVQPGVDLTSNVGLADVMDGGATVDALR